MPTTDKGNFDFEGNFVVEKFKKKLKHGHLYCEIHDEMKIQGTPWDAGPFDSGIEYICLRCSQESVNE